jgi:type III secretory pathway component EscT
MEALAGGGIYLGMVIGFVAGMAFQAARHAIQNLRKTRESIPGLKDTASGARLKGARWLLFGVLYAAFVLFVIVRIR